MAGSIETLVYRGIRFTLINSNSDWFTRIPFTHGTYWGKRYNTRDEATAAAELVIDMLEPKENNE